MSFLESVGYENIKFTAMSWWESKSKDEQLKLETQFAILAPTIGTVLGTFLVFIVL